MAAVFASVGIVIRDPLLRLATVGLFLFGISVASVMPYASLVGVGRFAISDAAYSIVLYSSSVVMVVASVVTGIVSDQRANRRQLLISGLLFSVVGYAIVFVVRSPAAFMIAHVLLLPLGATVLSQLFALARIAARAYGEEADQIFSTVRAAFSASFVLAPPAWSFALAAGANLVDVYLSAFVATAVFLGLAAFIWPARSRVSTEAKSGLRFMTALREISGLGVLARIFAVGLITGSNALYMVLFGLLIVKVIGGTAADVGRFHGAIALLEIPFMLLAGRALLRMSKPGLVALGGTVYAGFLFLFAVMPSMTLTYLLVLPASFGAAIILSVSISYLQDLVAARPGAGSALMAVANFVGAIVSATAFAAGTAFTGYAGTAVLGAMLALTGSMMLLVMDGWRKPYPAGA